MDEFISAAKTSDLDDGETMLVEAGDERILLSKVEGKFYAVSEACTHFDGPLSDGYVEGDEVECPWHGGKFNLRTGESTNPPATEPLRCYAVRVEAGDVLVGPS